MKHTAFTGRLLILGFGSIGQGVLPLILRHIDMPKDRIEILTSDARGEAIAAQHGGSPEKVVIQRGGRWCAAGCALQVLAAWRDNASVSFPRGACAWTALSAHIPSRVPHRRDPRPGS